jgi:hypothetical protein
MQEWFMDQPETELTGKLENKSLKNLENSI